MSDEQTRLEDAAWIKFRNGEPMSKADLERFLGVFARRDFNIEVPNQQDVGVIKMKMAEVFGRWMPKPQ